MTQTPIYVDPRVEDQSDNFTPTTQPPSEIALLEAELRQAREENARLQEELRLTRRERQEVKGRTMVFKAQAATQLEEWIEKAKQDIDSNGQILRVATTEFIAATTVSGRDSRSKEIADVTREMFKFQGALAAHERALRIVKGEK